MRTTVFFFNDTATTEIYTLSLHDALPILRRLPGHPGPARGLVGGGHAGRRPAGAPDRRGEHDRVGDRGTADRKSTRLNSSHANISYAVFCLKKKKSLVLAPRSIPSPMLSL